MANAKDFFSPEEKKKITDAIRQAEDKTSGEIRVHLEDRCPGGDPMARALKIFAKLGMHRTELRNGVLFYLAVKDRKFAILADEGINRTVEDGFWDQIKTVMEEKFKNGDFLGGLVTGIGMAGEKLKKAFPVSEDDINELSDEISFNED